MMKCREVFVAFLVMSAAAMSAAKPAAAAPIDALDRFIGTWQGEGTFVTTPYQKAGSATGTTTCAWSTDRLFVICQQRAEMNGAHDSDIAIYTYDSTAKVYRFSAVRAGQTNSMTITVDDKTVTYPASFTDAGKTVLVRTVNVWQSADLYRWRTEYSTDNGKTWTFMGSGTSKRQ